MIKNRHIWRWLFIVLLTSAAFVGLIVRLCALHLGPNEKFRERIARMRAMEQKLVEGRGRIFDRNGAVLAMDLSVQNVWVDPDLINRKGYARFIGSHLARVLRLDPAMVLSKINRADRQFEYVARFVPGDTAGKISEMKLPGVYFEETVQRHYPQGPLMCHVVGFANQEGVGSAGIEQRLDRYLRGSPGLRVGEVDGRRREVFLRRSLEIPAQEGSDVYLTIDSSIQYIVEKALDQAMETNHARAAWAIVQRVKTGEILGMASRPAFDLNRYRDATEENKRNRAISYVYEPGSTFKMAVIAAALNEGAVRTDQIFDCENGVWYYKGRPLHDYRPNGMLSVADIIKKSSNIGAAKVALELGPEKLESYLRKFGYGQKIGIDLPGEEGGIFYRRSRWTDMSPTRIAMGHEIAVTSLQILSTLATIANNGFLMRPYILQRIVDAKGRAILETQPEVLARPIRTDTAATMRGLLARVTEKGGTGARAALKDYKVAGKSGTAQKPVPGGYSDSANIASFVGCLPADDPEVAIIIVVDEPQPEHTGGLVAAPVFRSIAEEIMRYIASRPAGWTETARTKAEGTESGS